MEGPTTFLYFQKFSISRGRGWGDLLHFSISRNSAFLELGGGGEGPTTFLYYQEFCISRARGGGEGPTTFLYFQEFCNSRARGWRDLRWKALVPRFLGIL